MSERPRQHGHISNRRQFLGISQLFREKKSRRIVALYCSCEFIDPENGTDGQMPFLVSVPHFWFRQTAA
jgi:hypothetical protein